MGGVGAVRIAICVHWFVVDTVKFFGLKKLFVLLNIIVGIHILRKVPYIEMMVQGEVDIFHHHLC